MKRRFLMTMVTLAAFFWGNMLLADTITIVGTGSGSAVLKSVGRAFSTIHPEVTITVPESIGSGGGIKAVGNDKNPLGRVAREINDRERAYQLTYLPYAKNPIVFFVNKNVGIKGLTTQQVCDIYCGKITNWKQVGGRDAKIRVIRREDGDSSLEVLLKSFPGFAGISLTEKSKTTFSDPITCELAERKENTIAFGTYANARNYDVNILTINGKNPTAADYDYVGTLALIFKEKNRNGNIDKFVSFVTSQAAHNAIRRAGALPL